VGFDLNFLSAVAENARKIFDICRKNWHLWVDAPHEKLSGASLFYSAVRYQQSRYLCFADVVFRLKIDASKVLKLVHKVKDLLLYFDARAVLAAFLQNIEKTVPRLLPRVKLLAPLVPRLWAEINRDDVFKTHLIHAHWQRIIASCIFAVLLSNDIWIEIRVICAAVGACQLGDSRHRLDVQVALLIMDRKEHSLSDRAIKARRTQKLERRVQRQQSMQGPMMPRIDALLVSIPVIELQKDDCASCTRREPRATSQAA
jgi:hypothetical protein